MILTDREIKIAIDQKIISIDPPPSGDKYSSSSVDLTLGRSLTKFREAEPGIRRSIDFSRIENHDSVLNDVTETIQIDPKNGYELEPREFVLAWTAEHVDLKLHSQIAARVEGKSSLARFGIAVHITAPTIHSGFNGCIRLEVANHGTMPVTLREGMKFCQLIFEQTLGTPEKGYQGQFQHQNG